MAIKVQCPQCKTNFSAQDSYHYKVITCPKCFYKFRAQTIDEVKTGQYEEFKQGNWLTSLRPIYWVVIAAGVIAVLLIILMARTGPTKPKIKEIKEPIVTKPAPKKAPVKKRPVKPRSLILSDQWETCPKCEGTGKKWCSLCLGTGRCYYYDSVYLWYECTRCGGTGRAKCWRCDGTGKIRR